MRTLALVAAAALAALTLVPAPAAATHYPLYFTRTYQWDVQPPPDSLETMSAYNSFTVPATATMLCYERTYYSGYEASTIHVVLRDGANRVVVEDYGGTVGFGPVTIPIGGPLAPIGTFQAGTFTLGFEGWGDNLYATIRVYAITAASQCGTYKSA